MIGRTLSHYRITAPLGSGGMGVVWRARDLHLDRDVALKVLPDGALASAADRLRFHREALALSRLSQPHIATVYDFDTEGGVDFLVMELVEGEPLAARIARGPLPEAQVRSLGAQIAEGLAAAHEKDIVHRDLKPANIMLTRGDQVKVLDFGLAQLSRPGRPGDAAGGRAEPGGAAEAAAKLTETGVTLGTFPYMAPEQLLGQAVDARADLWALGIVLHEMATGRLPYRSTLPTALVNEILHAQASPLRQEVPGISASLETIVARCLAKAPADRHASARALAFDLADQGRTVEMPKVRRGQRWPGARRLAAAVAVLAVAGTLAGLLLADVGGLRSRLSGTSRSGSIKALAVLPLENLSRDREQDYFAEGMTDELITRLSQVAALRVISRSSAMHYRGTTKRPPQIARELHVDDIVEGTVMPAGSRARITIQLIQAATDHALWGDSFEGDLRDVLSLQNRVAREIVDRIRVSLTPRERAVLARARPVDPAVNDAVLRGKSLLNQDAPESWSKGLAEFNRAIALDPRCAAAYAGLAVGYEELSNVSLPPHEAMPKAKAAALRALELDSTSVEARQALAYVTAFYDWNWTQGEQEYRRALQLSPGLADVRRNHGYYLLCVGRFDESLADMQQAVRLDPLSSYTLTMSLWPLFEGRRYAQAIAGAESMLRADSTLGFVRMILGQSLMKSGDLPHAIRELRRASQEVSSYHPRVWLACAYAAAGRLDSTRAILRHMRANVNQLYVTPYGWALIYAALGEKDAAFDWLNDAIATRSEDLTMVQCDPGLDPLRSDPRFTDVLRRVGFRPARGRPG